MKDNQNEEIEVLDLLEETPTQEENKNKKDNKSLKVKDKNKEKKIVLICMTIFVALLLISSICFVVYNDFLKEDTTTQKEESTNKDSNIKKPQNDISDIKPDDKENNNEEKDKCESKIKEEKFDHTLKIYTDGAGYYSLEKNSAYNKVAHKIDVNSSKSELYDYYPTYGEIEYILYKDNSLKLLNTKTNKVTEINFDNTKDGYKMHINDTGLIGLIYYNATSKGFDENCNEIIEYTNYGYYNVNYKKTLYENQYAELVVATPGLIMGYTSTKENGPNGGRMSELHLLYVSLEKVLVQIPETEILTYSPLVPRKFGNASYYVRSEGSTGPGYEIIYSNTGKHIFTGTEGIDWSMDAAGNLYVKDSNVVKRYNANGQLLYQTKQIDKIVGLAADKIIYYEKGQLMINDFKNSYTNKIANISYSEDDYVSISNGKYDHSSKEIINKHLIYIHIINEDLNKDIEIEYNPSTKKAVLNKK